MNLNFLCSLKNWRSSTSLRGTAYRLSSTDYQERASPGVLEEALTVPALSQGTRGTHLALKCLATDSSAPLSVSKNARNTSVTSVILRNATDTLGTQPRPARLSVGRWSDGRFPPVGSQLPQDAQAKKAFPRSWPRCCVACAMWRVHHAARNMRHAASCAALVLEARQPAGLAAAHARHVRVMCRGGDVLDGLGLVDMSRSSPHPDQPRALILGRLVCTRVCTYDPPLSRTHMQ